LGDGQIGEQSPGFTSLDVSGTTAALKRWGAKKKQLAHDLSILL
jgi:hypothetical protein